MRNLDMMMGKQRKNKSNTLKHYKKQVDDDQWSLQYLPQHLLYKILAQIPVEQLLELRFACKWWNEVISESSFITHHMLQSEPSLLLQDPIKFKSKLLELDDHEGLGYKLKHFGLARKGKLLSSCNGLMLLDHQFWTRRRIRKRELLVVNTVTKCKVSIPECPSGCSHLRCSISLVFNLDLNQYKVVHILKNQFGLEIFTLGSLRNQWKVIKGPIIVENDESCNRPWTNPVSCSNGRFLRWDVFSDWYILSMDTYNESTRKTYLPPYYVSFDRARMSLIEMRGYLTFVYQDSSKQFDIWVLKDFQNHIWEQGYSILAESISYSLPKDRFKRNEYENALPNFGKLKAICSLREGEVIVFKQVKSLCLYLYDTKLKELKKLREMRVKDYNILQYKGSLFE